MADASITGLDALKARLQRLQRSSETAMKAAGVGALTVAQKAIINQGDGKWPAWSQNYRPKRSHQMLWDMGTLLRSLALGGAENVFEQDAQSVTVGTNVAYAAAQNFGIPTRNLPPRPFFVIAAMTKAAIESFRSAILGSLK